MKECVPQKSTDQLVGKHSLLTFVSIQHQHSCLNLRLRSHRPRLVGPKTEWVCVAAEVALAEYVLALRTNVDHVLAAGQGRCCTQVEGNTAIKEARGAALRSPFLHLTASAKVGVTGVQNRVGKVMGLEELRCPVARGIGY